ncbi:histidine phosphatase family protein [Schlesneria paludicola]|uniref:histidine phosphatase family protein n=1 Tax=Schlesneria paludicola TaxID=360056 RepID=UPI00029ACA28|nr:histidine phosphatase family protein [Schlesneria paludicola]
MSALVLVRHGQASFFASDYDKLSAIGEQQLRHVGTHWAAQRLVIDEVFTGPRMRQRDSARLAGEEYQKAGLTWPEPIVLDELDEYDLDGLTKNVAPQLAAVNSEFAQMAMSYLQSAGELDKLRSFQRMFEMLLRHWQADQSERTDVETWAKFRQRVNGVIRRVQTQTARSRRVVFFTSGGFIGCAAHLALAAPDATALELNWRVRNASFTEFVFNQDRLSLDSFNSVPHLEHPDLWTYR